MKHIIAAFVTLLTLAALSSEMDKYDQGQVIELNCNNYTVFCK